MMSEEQIESLEITDEDIIAAKYLDLKKAFKTIEDESEAIVLEIVAMKISEIISSMTYMVKQKVPSAGIISVTKRKLDDLQFLLAIDTTKELFSNILFTIQNRCNSTKILPFKKK